MNFTKLILLAFAVLFPTYLFPQELTEIAPLPPNIAESSGLAFVNGRLLSIQDSGNENIIFEIDTLTGEIIREVLVGNTQNTDWESITADENFIYIGDFGNNNGTRKDLKIYKVPLNEYLENEITQTTDIISFNYADQITFNSNPFATNFDAEALCAYGDSLVLFSKNWINGYSKIYKLPKTPGTYTIQVLDSINTQGLVTGCDCDDQFSTIHLIGHNVILSPFVVRLSNFNPNQITDGNIIRQDIFASAGQSTQVEGIAQSYPSKYFVSSESFFNLNAWLFEVNWDFDLSVETNERSAHHGFIFPNPSTGLFKVNFETFDELHIIDHSGRLVFSSKKSDQYTVQIEAGTYLIVLKNRNNEQIAAQRLLIVNK